MKHSALTASAAFCILLAGCGDDGSGRMSAESSFVAEEFCDPPGLEPSRRHTILLIDSSILAKTERAEDFVSQNSWIRDAVMDFADPSRAVGSGAAAPRERVTIIRLPQDGSAGQRVFTGCIPAMTAEEIQQASAEQSGVGTFFSGGVRDELEEHAGRFRTRLVAALQAAARAAEGEGTPQAGDIAGRGLFASLKSSSGLIESGQSVPRLVFLTDLSRSRRVPGDDTADARRAGFVQGQQLGVPLGGSEVVFVQRGGGDSMQRAYLDAFLLAQKGHLIYAGDRGTAALPSAPTSVRRFVGHAQYPDGPANIQIRIASDSDGRLVNSWVTLRDQNDRSLPLAGSISCDAGGICSIRSTNDGFGQLWSLAPGGEPEFDNEMPFGGMRNFEMRIEEDRLAGRVFDPLIDQVGADPNNDSIRIEASMRPDSKF